MNRKVMKLFSRVDKIVSHFADRPYVDYLNKLQEILSTLNYTDFVDNLQVVADDPKMRALIDNFMESGDRMYCRRLSIPVSDLIPTQNEIDVDKSLSWELNNVDSCKNCFSKSVMIKTPLITYDGKYIVDGHHRWSQVYCINSNAKMDCIDLFSKNLSPIDVLKITQLKIAADTGVVAVKKVNGQNLITCDLDKLAKYIDEKIKPDVVSYLMTKYNISDKSGVVDSIVNNVKEMRETSIPIKGAPDRGHMPQTDTIPEFENKVKSGEMTGDFN